MNPDCVRLLLPVLLSVICFPAYSAKKPEYGDIIKKTPEYKIITEGKDDNDRHDYHYHHPYRYPYPRPHYYPVYPSSYTYYEQSGSSSHGGLPGNFYLGLAIGDSEFDYDDIEKGDATIFHFGYRPRDSRIGYELSFFDSGDSDVTSLADIEIQVDSINLVLTINSSLNSGSRFNFFGQGGIYFADTTLSGPAGSVSEKSNGFILSAGIEIMLNQHFSLRAGAWKLHEVEDFANDESITVVSFGGQFVF
ncbi:MAG: porin family protein [Gammaproteobacteria bacterium]|nr:porin family protein [Gammaproteobacteria bacterium]